MCPHRGRGAGGQRRTGQENKQRFHAIPPFPLVLSVIGGDLRGKRPLRTPSEI
ncbi:hypothetical protein GCM10010116_10650 [Microbispora rosea subsp. aerata]|nr:hypothetical protein GCM10010116_10650 [Microbispora rosea subsp. aerata]GIH57251.1 hypothetical protein Mro02_41650 [Microbispora rosea subsp. aerata]GLJ83392.1 hypothetical protein GCM10017588_21200 [Microbispora rosea subsp. aerata]